MKKILIFIDWYTPAFKAGGPISSIYNLTQFLEEEINFYIVTSNKDLNSKKGLQGIKTNTWQQINKSKVIYLDNIIKSSRIIYIINYFIKKKKIRNIYFIIGSDNLIRFHSWKSWKKIVKLVKLIVFSRKGYDRKGIKSIVAKKFKNRIIFIKNKPISISSTQLRKRKKSNI